MLNVIAVYALDCAYLFVADSLMFSRKKRSSLFVIPVFTALFATVSPAYFGVYGDLLSLILAFIIPAVLYPKERFWKKIFVFILYLAFVLLSIVISSFIIGLLFGPDMMSYSISSESHRNADLILFIRGIIEYMLGFIGLLGMRAFFLRNKDSHNTDIFSYSLFLFSQVLLILSNLGLGRVYGNLPQDIHTNLLIVCGVICIVTDVLIYKTFLKNLRVVTLQSENQTLRAIRDMQYENCLELQKQIDKTALLRHDIHNHFEILRVLMSQDPNEARQYLERLMDTQLARPVTAFSAHPVINALLTGKAGSAEACGVRINFDLSLPDTLPIEDVDLVSLFSNLLDNAIEACQGMDSPDRRSVDLTAKLANSHLLISVKNEFKHSISFACGLPMTTKGAGHGLGTKTVRSIAEKYQGAAEFQFKNGVFTASVAIPVRSSVSAS